MRLKAFINTAIMRYFLAFIVCVLLFSFTGHYDVKSNTAEANQYDGIYVFSDCQPVREYTVLGSVKPGGRGMMAVGLKSQEYNDMRSTMIDRCKENYPTAEAIIVHMQPGNRYADAIKFK